MGWVRGKRILTGEEEEAWRRQHQEIADKYGMTIRGVALLARKLAIEDPLHCIYGEPIVVEAEQPLKRRRNVDDPWDFFCLTEVPEPFQQCDLILALREYERDCGICASLLERDERIEEVIENQTRWARFLAVRHPNAIMRQCFAEYEEAIASGEVEAWARKLKARCEAEGIKVTSERAALTMKVEEEG